jgi:hypothetical protein
VADLELPNDLRQRVEEWAAHSWESDELHRSGRPLYNEVVRALDGQYEIVWRDD